MNINKSQLEQNTSSRESVFFEARNDEMKNSNDLERQTSEIQAARYQIALLRMMHRTNDNPNLVNILNNFITALDHQANFGSSEKNLNDFEISKIIEFFEKSADDLRYLYGNQPANKSDWRK